MTKTNDAALIEAALATITKTITKCARDLVAGDVLVLSAPVGAWAATRTVVTHVEVTRKRGLIRTTEHGVAVVRSPWSTVTVEIVNA